MLFVHEVHQVAGGQGRRVRGRVPRGLDADARRGRRRPPALVHEPRPRQRRVVQRRHHHRRARRRGVGTPGAAHPERRPARVVARGRHLPPRRDRQDPAPRALVAHPGGRLRHRRRPTGASTSCTCSWRTPAGRRRRSTTTSRRGTTSTGSRCCAYADDMRAIPIDIQACFQIAHGSSLRREAMLWQYIPDPATVAHLLDDRAAARAAGAGHLHVRRARLPRPVEEPAPQDRGLVTALLTPRARRRPTTGRRAARRCPGSTRQPGRGPGPSRRRRARRASSVTVVGSPGSSPTLANAFSSFGGRDQPGRPRRRDVALHHLGAAPRRRCSSTGHATAVTSPSASAVDLGRADARTSCTTGRDRTGTASGAGARRTSGTRRAGPRRSGSRRSRRGSCRTTGCARAHREGGGQPAAGLGVAEEHVGERVAPSPGRRTTPAAPRARRRPSAW